MFVVEAADESNSNGPETNIKPLEVAVGGSTTSREYKIACKKQDFWSSNGGKMILQHCTKIPMQTPVTWKVSLAPPPPPTPFPYPWASVASESAQGSPGTFLSRVRAPATGALAWQRA
ncbi:LOW QUALITY PROTEIN: hypothetical protein PoB_007446300 [Plakobranchus ocellatus]|uniref:Uncharacterized protein n=1 Tax=Plakobranchus ocellatus TaxID=259542 RepID=A0AAV4DUK9_9GAST|nr:LOW QUALITY PROTEIN: hypothetical protein PoB_007446300 [Plakobranchus ocellatus]